MRFPDLGTGARLEGHHVAIADSCAFVVERFYHAEFQRHVPVVDGSVGLDENSSDSEYGQELVVESRGCIQAVGANGRVPRQAAGLVGPNCSIAL